MRFSTTVVLGGKTATGMQVPDDVVAALGSSRRPAVRVTVSGHTYRTTVAMMGGRFMVPLSAENRASAGVSAGDEVEVNIEVDTALREVEVPGDLDEAFAADPAAAQRFTALAYSHRKEWVRWVEDAKKPETRASRVADTVRAVGEGKRTR